MTECDPTITQYHITSQPLQSSRTHPTEENAIQCPLDISLLDPFTFFHPIIWASTSSRGCGTRGMKRERGMTRLDRLARSTRDLLNTPRGNHPQKSRVSIPSRRIGRHTTCAAAIVLARMRGENGYDLQAREQGQEMRELMTGALAFLAVCVTLWAGVHAAGWLLICGAEYLGREIRAPFPPHEMIVR